MQAYASNATDLLTPPFPEESNGLGLSVELDAFSEISLNQPPTCDTPESLPSFQETYPCGTAPFKMEEDHFNFGNQFPFPHQHHQQQPSHLSSQCQQVAAGCGSVAYDFAQLFSPVPNAAGGAANFHMQHTHQRHNEAQLHSPMHSYGQHPQPIFEAPSQPLDTMQPYGFGHINAVPDMQNVGLKQRRGASMTHRNHHLLK